MWVDWETPVGDWETQEGQYCIHTSEVEKGVEKREGKSLCGGNHITSLLCERGKKKSSDSFL